MSTKHTVKSGDTLSEIAQRYNTTVGAIRDANPDLIKNVNLIRVGWVLTIPTGDGDKKPTTTTTTTKTDFEKLLKEALDDIGCLASVKKLLSLL